MGTEDNDVRRRLSRRAFLRAAALSGGTVLLAACGATSSTPSDAAQSPTGAADTSGAPAAATTGPATVSGDKVTIEWANRYSSEVTQQVIPLMVAEFEKLYPNITVNYENPGTGEGYDEKILARIAAGDSPDVMICNTTPIEYAVRGSLMDITAQLQSSQFAKPDAIFPGPLASCTWQGKIYGLPSSAGAGAIFTNVGLLQEKGMPTDRESFPKTWADWRAMSKEFVVQDNGSFTQAGFVPFAGNAWLYPVWSALNGGQIYDSASNTYKLNSENNVQWLNFWLEWLDEQYGGNVETFNTAGNWADAYSDGLFSAGKMAGVHSGSWVATDAQIPFQWEAVKFPVGPSGSKSVTGFYPNWWAVPTGAKHPQEAYQFVEFVATRGWETWYKYILDTPSWKNFPPNVITDKLVQDVGQEKAVDINTFFSDYLNDAIPMWDSPIELFAQETIANSVSEVLNKRKDAKTALEEAQQICQTKLQEVAAS